MCDFLEIEFIDSTDSKSSKQKKSHMVTDSLLTPYEYARLLSCRAKQIEAGYEIQVEWKGIFDPISIAKVEIEQRVVPLSIVRHIPDNTKLSGFRDETWDLKDLDIRNC